MAYDLIIRNGLVVDGTGAAPRMADLAVQDGRIAEIGKVSGTAARQINADGRAVAPGFIDPHTHYDAQLCWDADLSPSPWHGVTTVVTGNCGVGVAPCAPGTRETAMYDLVNVEGMPYDVLSRGINWDWETFPEYMDSADRRHTAVNLAFLAPLTPFRYHVMGAEAVSRAAKPDETAQIAQLLKEAVEAGAFGFSTTMLQAHIGHGGLPLACRQADDAELRAYARAVGSTGKGTLQVALTQEVSVISDENHRILDMLSTASGGRPITFSALLFRDDKPNACADSLKRLESLMARGVVPQISARPLMRDMDLRSPFSFQGFKSWAGVFNKNVPDQIAFYRNTGFRNRFREELQGPGQFTGNWELICVAQVGRADLKPHEGKTIAQIARETGKDGVDALLDFGIEDNLDTEFTASFLNTNEAGVSTLLRDSRTLVGLADGGAHLAQLCDAGYTTYMLGHWVRERRVLPLEYAVKRLSAEPADVFGIKDRGRLVRGLAADIVVFDPATVGSGLRGERWNDLPGGARRVVMPSRGVDYTIVNGGVTYDHGQMTDIRAGRTLRS